MPNDPDREAIHQRNVQNAGIYADLIAKILAEATAADHRVCSALEGLRALSYGQNEWQYNQASDGAQTAAAALGLSKDAIPATGANPTDVKRWWDGLSPDERQIYLTAWPDKVGALDGLPAADRDAANQLALRTYLGENVNTF